MRQGKWLWGHKPEIYVREKFAEAKAHIENGAPFDNTNLPTGHIPQEWTVEEEIAKKRSGIFKQDLKSNGDWSLV